MIEAVSNEELSAGQQCEQLEELSSQVEGLIEGIQHRSPRAIARAITLVENQTQAGALILEKLEAIQLPEAMTLGITGTGGAGKSTLVSGLIGLLRRRGKRVGVIAVDPSSPLSGGAVLGDRIRMMGHSLDQNVLIRSMASRGQTGGLSSTTAGAALIFKAAGCDPIIVETVGVGQAEFDIVRQADLTALVLAPGLGDDIQAMKSGLVELVDVLVINKGDLPGADALQRDMEPVAMQRDRELVRVSAKEETGLEELWNCVARAFDKSHTKGKLAARRQESRDVQAKEAALQMVQALIQGALDRQDDATKQQTPRRRAIDALATIFSGKSGAFVTSSQKSGHKKSPTADE